MKKVLVVAAAVLATLPSYAAQKTKAQLTTEITTMLPTNGQGLITASALRTVVQDMVDSSQQIQLLNQQTGTTYTFVAGDQGKLVTFSNSSPMAIYLPAAQGDFASGWNVLVQNLGSGTATITVSAGTINGGGTLSLAPNQIAYIISYGPNTYWASTTLGYVSSTTPNQMFQSQSNGSPVWSTSTWPATTTVNQILYSSSANAVAGLATLNGGILNTSSAGVPSITNAPTLGVVGSSVGSLAFANATSGTVTLQPVTGALGSSVLSVPAATDTLIGRATTDTLTNKTFDTAGTGNVFKINGTQVSSVTGSGAAVLATSPTLTTPNIGAATATSLNKVAITAPGTSATLTIANGKTATISNTLTFTGTDSSSVALGSGGTVAYTIASGSLALATTSIASAACSTAQTATATGTATTDVVLASFNGDPTAVTGYIPSTTGMLSIIAYPTANTVNFKVCNNTAAPITPGAITLNWRVVR